MQKRGQITIFIIIGIVLIAIIALTLGLRTDLAKSAVKKAASLTESFATKSDNVKVIAEDCLKSKLQEAVILYGNRKVEDYEKALANQIESSIPVCLDFSSVDGVDVNREGNIEIVTELNADKSAVSATATLNIEINHNEDHQTIENVYAEVSFAKKCCVPVRVDSDCMSKDSGTYKVCGFVFEIQDGDSLGRGGNCLAC